MNYMPLRPEWSAIDPFAPEQTQAIDPWNPDQWTTNSGLLPQVPTPVTPPLEPAPTHPTARTSTPRFKIGQEVFILDNNGRSDPMGLATYLIISSNEMDPSGLRHYRIVPLVSRTCRAGESRLFEVGYALGAEVKRVGDPVPSIVVKRYVVKGERLYCLKDSLGFETDAVREKELQPHFGGTFPFVTNSI